MSTRDPARLRGYALAAGLGALGGGLVVALATRALPTMLSRMMTAMMQGMMAGEDCDPAEM